MSETEPASDESTQPDNPSDLFGGRFTTSEALKRIRKRLLDLTSRNRLLNFRWSKGRVLRVIDTVPDGLYVQLIDGKTLTFSPVPDPPRRAYEQEGSDLRKPDVKKYAESLGINTSYELPTPSTETSRHIQSLYYPEDLERLLHKIGQAARIAIEESGTNMLYLVFGFLEWSESLDSDKSFYAPLLTVPVFLERGKVDYSTGYYRYDISYNGEDISDNITLREKLRQDFGLELPDLEEEDTPEVYFKKTARLARTKPNWKVHRQITLTLLSFGKLLMYLDLDPIRWPKDKTLDKHPLIRDIFEGVQKDGDSSDGLPPEDPVEEDPDTLNLPIIYDADSSQHSVLLNALAGKNMVVEGPPGTGKSQTITNLIAAALTAGKTVLFVSEKLAALEVVRRRLDAAGLGIFCLELHSHKTQKKKLLEDIATRIREKGKFKNPAPLDNKFKELESKRQRLKRYADIMNSVLHNQLGLTVHQVLWASQRHRMELRNKANQFSGVEICNATDCSNMEFAEMDETVRQFCRHFAEIGYPVQEHPWYGFYPYKMNFGDETTITNLFGKIATRLSEIAQEMIRLWQEHGGLMLPCKKQEQITLYRNLTQDIPDPAGTEAFDLLPDLYSKRAIAVVSSIEQKINYVRTLGTDIKHRLKDPDTITENGINEAAKAIKKADLLNQINTNTQVIADRGKALEKLGKELNNAIEFYMDVMNQLGINVPLTVEGVGLLNAVLKVAGTAPLDLLDYRRAQFADPSALRIICDAIEQGVPLKKRHSSLSKSFILFELPPREEISQAIVIFRQQHGLFCFFRSDWHKARRLYKSISITHRFILRSRECQNDLTELISYLDSRATFDTHVSYKEAMGELFQGIDTDFERIEKVARWCKTSNEALTPHNTPTFNITTFITLPAEKLIWLASKTAETERHWQIVETFIHRTNNIFDETLGPASLGPEKATLDIIRDRIFDVGRTMQEIADTFHALTTSPESPSEIMKLLEHLRESRKIRKEIEEDPEIRSYLKRYYQGVNTDFVPINAALEWCGKLHDTGLPSSIEEWLIKPEAKERFSLMKSTLSIFSDKWEEIDEIVNRIEQFGSLEVEKWLYDDENTPQEITPGRLLNALDHSENLMAWADLSRARYHADRLGLPAVTSAALDGTINVEEVQSTFKYIFYNSITRAILRHSPELMEFSGLSHDEVRKKFAEIDREVIRLTGERCAHIIDKRPVPIGNMGPRVKDYTNMTLLLHEIGKKSRHIPIRQLIKRAGMALKELKPCVMMGPLSVAQYLEPGMLQFDLIIMDEASQLRPEEALGAIARGKQLVVVGDPKQLPPTIFFDRLLGDTDITEEEESTLEGVESILDICQTIYHPPRTLRWHYRSQHESLIAFSNRHFYDSRLIVFPSPHGHNQGLGLRYHYFQNAIYDNRRNHEEAKQVADAVINHLLEYPDESIGVVTLNITQRDLIEEELERRFKHYTEADTFLQRWEKESFPFFVKNLENVQGDERDVIFISTTFGRNPQGVVRLNFGPINQATGWRRLNVLFTRARRRIELFTSMQPDDIVVDETSPRGVKALRDYLSYVKQGILESPEYPDREPDSDFEIAVTDLLRNHGYEVVPQLGVANFFIDIAVRNPFHRGAFLAAIECDGASYHAARSVRERDRLRQQILEGLGWKGKIYRIWSTDWFKDPKNQIQRLLEFLDKLKQSVQTGAPAQPAAPLRPITPQPEFEEVVQHGILCVEVGDHVTYCHIETPDDRKSVQIIKGHSDLTHGIIRENTPLAQALLEAEVGDEVELNVPGRPKSILRIIDIESNKETGWGL